jgi:DNA-binding transcriptional LysR family regulator
MRELRIDLRHVRYVVAAAQSGSFRRAGDALGVEQSAISRRIRDLEVELGGALFRRHSGGVELTELGHLFVAQAVGGMDQIAFAVNHARAAAVRLNDLRVGVFGPLTMEFFANLIAAFRQECENVSLQFHEESSSALLAAMSRRELDIAFVVETPPEAGMPCVHLWDEPVYLAVPTGHPLAERQSIEWHDLLDCEMFVSNMPTGDFATAYVHERLRAIGEPPALQQLSVTRESLLQIVAHGSGVTISSSAYVRLAFPGVLFRPIRDAGLPYHAVVPRGTVHRHARRLLTLARSMAARGRRTFR